MFTYVYVVMFMLTCYININININVNINEKTRHNKAIMLKKTPSLLYLFHEKKVYSFL